MLNLIIGALKDLAKMVYLFFNRHRAEQEPKRIEGFFGSYKINPVKAGFISIDSEINSIDECPAQLPDIKVHVFDEKKHEPLRGKLVSVELNHFSDTDYLSGVREKITNKHGEAVFKKLKVNCTGTYELKAKSDECETISASFAVTWSEEKESKPSIEKDLPALPEKLSEKYVIISKTEKEGETVTYSAQSIGNKHYPVTIIEYQKPDKTFIDFVQKLQQLNGHPNIVRTDSYFDIDNTSCFYVIKEKLQPLAGTNDIRIIQQIGTEICRALNYSNEKGVFPFSIHPENICTQNGHYKFDFLAGQGNTETINEETEISSLGSLLYYLYQPDQEKPFQPETATNDLKSATEDDTQLIGILKKASVFQHNQKYKTIAEMQMAFKTIKINTNKSKRKTMPIAAICIVALLLITGIVAWKTLFMPKKKIPKAADGDTFHVTLTTSGSDYDNKKEILQTRLDTFAGKGNYLCIENKKESNYVKKVWEIYLPTICFKDFKLEHILDKFIANTVNPYMTDIFNSQRRIPISRDNIENISVRMGSIPNIDASQYMREDPTYSFIEITLKDEFVNQYKAEYDTWPDCSFVFEADALASSQYWYQYHTFPAEDGKTFYLLERGNSEIFDNLLCNQLSNPALSESFEYEVDINYLVQWEDPVTINRSGKLQCAFDDFSDSTETFFLQTDYPRLIPGDEGAEEYRTALIRRLDALGEPYALGWGVDLGWGHDKSEEQIPYGIESVAIKTKLNHINDDIKRIIGKHNDIRVQSHSCFSNVGMENMIKTDYDDKIIMYIDLDTLPSFQTDEIYKMIKASYIDNGDILYIMCDEFPVMQINAKEENEYGAIPVSFCQINGGIIRKLELSEDNKWYSDFIMELIRTNPMMKANYFYDQYYTDEIVYFNPELAQMRYNPDTEGKMPDPGKHAPLLSTGQEELEAFVKVLNPKATVTYCAGYMWVDTYFRVNDQFPSEFIDFIQRFLQEIVSGRYYVKRIGIAMLDEEEPETVIGSLIYDKPYQNISSSESVAELVGKGRNIRYDSFDLWRDAKNYQLEMEDILETISAYEAKPLLNITFSPCQPKESNHDFEMYSGPSESYMRSKYPSGNTGNELLVAGYMDGLLLIQYATKDGYQMAYTYGSSIGGSFPQLKPTPYAGIIEDHSGEADTCMLTDGVSSYPLEWGTPVTILGRIESDYYVEAVIAGKMIRGRVPGYLVDW